MKGNKMQCSGAILCFLKARWLCRVFEHSKKVYLFIFFPPPIYTQVKFLRNLGKGLKLRLIGVKSRRTGGSQEDGRRSGWGCHQ